MVTISLLSKNTTNLTFFILSVISKRLTMDMGYYSHGNNNNDNDNNKIRTEENAPAVYYSDVLSPAQSAQLEMKWLLRGCSGGELGPKRPKPLPAGDTLLP